MNKFIIFFASFTFFHTSSMAMEPAPDLREDDEPRFNVDPIKEFELLMLECGQHSELPVKNKLEEIEQEIKIRIVGEKAESPDGDSDPKEHYWGALGNDYYRMYQDNIVIPTLTEFFKSIRTGYRPQRLNDIKRKALFESVLKYTGSSRRVIAEKTQSLDKNYFGRLAQNEIASVDRSCDGIDPLGYREWNDVVRDSLKQLLPTHEAFLYTMQYAAKNFCDGSDFNLKIGNKNFTITKYSLGDLLARYAERRIRLGDESSVSAEIYRKNKVPITLLRFAPFLPDLHESIEAMDSPELKASTRNELAKSLFFRVNITGEPSSHYAQFTLFILIADPDGTASDNLNSETLFDVLDYSPLCCFHLWKSPRGLITDAYNVEYALNHLINIIFFVRESSEDINKLKAEFAQFLRWMSVSTIFVRGQASITRSIMSGLAESHGLRLKYVKDWNSFGYNPDMRALSSFDIDTFIKDFCENVELVPLDT